jgi:ribosomal protein S18 acetylase RimI-like enzyme
MIVIEKAKTTDIPDLCQLLSELFSIETDFQVDGAKQARGLELLLTDEKSVILTARDNGQVVGMVTVQIVISTAEGGKSAILEDMVVKSEYRGNGIGASLLQEAEEWAQKSGALRIQLLADTKNEPALSFYSRNGWCGTDLKALKKLFLE